MSRSFYKESLNGYYRWVASPSKSLTLHLSTVWHKSRVYRESLNITAEWVAPLPPFPLKGTKEDCRRQWRPKADWVWRKRSVSYDPLETALHSSLYFVLISGPAPPRLHAKTSTKDVAARFCVCVCVFFRRCFFFLPLPSRVTSPLPPPPHHPMRRENKSDKKGGI